MDPNQSVDLFIRSQDLLLPDDLDGESSSRYTPGSALRNAESSVSDRWKTRLTLPQTRDYEANLFLRSQDLLEPDDLEMDSRGYTPGSASRRSTTSLSEGWRSKLASLRDRGFERMESVRDRMTERATRVSTVRDGVTARIHGMGRELREHPAKWASIAAGAGVGMGFAGRMLMRMRARARRQMPPSLIIVETC